jgi:hypothetical protein
MSVKSRSDDQEKKAQAANKAKEAKEAEEWKSGGESLQHRVDTADDG